MASLPMIGGALQKLKITSSTLLSFMDFSVNAEDCCLPPISMVTNEVVLDLYHFMCRYSRCTYKILTQWLLYLYGDKWPSDNPPSVKAVTQSIKRLLAKLDKLKKLPNSIDKQQKISCLLNEQFSLPHIFESSELQSVEELSPDSSEGIVALRTINKKLGCQLAELKRCEPAVDPNLKLLREKMYSLQRNTNKKLGDRDKAISEQAERIDKQKLGLDKLQRKITQMGSHIQQLKKDKERLRHKAVHSKTKTYHSSSEDCEIEAVTDKQQEVDILQSLEDHNSKLQKELNELSTEERIETFCKGRFSDDVRTCCHELLSLNIGIMNVEPVIRSVMKNLVHQSIGRLPSHTALCKMMLEGLTPSETQLGEKLSEEEVNRISQSELMV